MLKKQYLKTMNNKELLFNLIKKIDSGEIKVKIDISNHFVEVGLIEDKSKEKIDLVYFVNQNNSQEISVLSYGNNWNKEFKENFYKEKGLDKCWVKNCPNKIYQTAGDYKAVNIPCQDKHKRYICLNCYGNK